MTAREGEVLFLDQVFFEPPVRRPVGVRVPGDEEDAARLAVDPVYGQMRALRIKPRKELEYARLSRIRAGNRQQPRGLIHGDKVSVFPKNREFGVHALTVSG